MKASAVLTGVLLLLVALNYLIWASNIDVSPIAGTPPARANDAKRTLSDFRLEPNLVEALAKPLFSPQRKDFVAPAPPAEPEAAPIVELAQDVAARPTLKLSGTRMIRSEPAALLTVASTGTVEWYKTGQSIEGWTIEAINDQTVSLISGERRITVAIEEVGATDGQ